jgi:1-deoxy-D-xylulose-5-phosphate synthase
VAVLNARFAKPLDREKILRLAGRCRVIVTVEEHAGMGGFGSAVLELLAEVRNDRPVRCLAVPDALIEHGNSDAQLAALRLDADGIAAVIRELLAEA